MGKSRAEKMGTNVEKAKSKGRGLIDLVFSWSLADVLNKKLYKGKVEEIPSTFSSTCDYMKSFIYPLIEETYADLFSCMETVPRAPTSEIFSVKISKNNKPPNDLYYDISLKRKRDIWNDEQSYDPEVGDLFALTEVRPKHKGDLNRPRSPYLVAFVQKKNDDKLTIRSSKPMDIMFYADGQEHNKKRHLFAVYLTNMTTNIRIWSALHSELEGRNMNIVKTVLQTDSNIEANNCSQCLSQENGSAAVSRAKNAISSFKLDDSQKAAVFSCVATRECCHQNTVKLIWGPPGTGKTKTVASLLFALLKMKCRTLTCAPTNIAVLGVTARLMSLVRDALEYDTYGLGDIVLFGNGERMKIDDHDDLFDVFLDYRVSILASCFAPLSGWKHNVESMICLLEDPKELYRLYLEKEKKQDDEDGDDEVELEETNFGGKTENDNDNKDMYDQGLKATDKKEFWRKKIVQTLKENKKKKKQNKKEASHQRKSHSKSDKREDNGNPTESNENCGQREEMSERILTLEDFFVKRIKFIGNQLVFFITNLYTHMPTAYISLEVVKKMITALDLLQRLGTLLYTPLVANEELRAFLYGVDDAGNRSKHFAKFTSAKTEFLQILKCLQESLSVPNITEWYRIKSFCLQNAFLIFCTASSSAKLHTEGKKPIELLVIDEAAQLKECESTIPLQLCGLRHAILIGDERQLPAMVKSEICQKAEFGRSLFQRLVVLGHQKHLLCVQYRMHPSISLFPNREFYDSKILDGPNVRESSYKRRFLQGNMYGSYSFINVTYGKEDFDSRHSTKNLVEIAVIEEIVASLFKVSVATKQKVRVGCISPYKAQVFALEEKLGKTYNTEANSDFSVSVRSVDGFQGGEEDLIIISTVRCNGRGSVGFLSNCQRTNVALTRARHCLWIVGNGATLINSGSVWEKLVLDAKARGCFHNAIDGKNMAQAVAGALVELNELDSLLTPNSPLFHNTRWKVCFSGECKQSMTRIKNVEVRKKVLSVLKNISSGWHQHPKQSVLNMNGTSSELLELHKVSGLLYLAWSVDVARENSKDIQVLKVWDVLPLAEIPKLAEHVDTMSENYTVTMINRCKCRKLEGNLVVPETWPTDSSAEMKSSLAYTDHVQFLESQVASLTLKEETRSVRNRNRRKQWTQKSQETEQKPCGFPGQK